MTPSTYQLLQLMRDGDVMRESAIAEIGVDCEPPSLTFRIRLSRSPDDPVSIDTSHSLRAHLTERRWLGTPAKCRRVAQLNRDIAAGIVFLSRPLTYVRTVNSPPAQAYSVAMEWSEP